MPARRPNLLLIKTAIRRRTYDMTAHAAEEMAEDGLDIIDVETAVLAGTLVKTETDDPRGVRFTLQGTATDGVTVVGVVGRLTEAGRYLIITVYEVRD
ncbi:MAG: DUF4258 domain-containing protein [Dehalococcoidia bacterium]